jgi:hypothetical protein
VRGKDEDIHECVEDGQIFSQARKRAGVRDPQVARPGGRECIGFVVIDGPDNQKLGSRHLAEDKPCRLKQLPYPLFRHEASDKADYGPVATQPQFMARTADRNGGLTRWLKAVQVDSIAQPPNLARWADTFGDGGSHIFAVLG